MPLKTSFFNPTLFRKNLSRSWSLWGGVTVVGALLPLYFMLAAINSPEVQIEAEDFTSFLYQAAVYFLPAFTFCYSVLVAMFVWSYLHNARSVGFMHSLAIDRTGLFVTNTLSGLAMLLIPYVVVGGLLVLLFACYGAVDLGAVFLTIAAVLLETLLFFGMATLCAAATGSVIVTAAYYLLLNFIVPAMDLLISSLAKEFIFGLTGEVGELSVWFSPVVSLYEYVGVYYQDMGDQMRSIPCIEGFGVIVVYGLIGIALLALSWYLMRVRRSESAGDVVAFRWMRPVFRFGAAIVSSLTLGRVLYELFWASIFMEGRYASIVPMGICMAVSAVVGYYAASMLLEKTLRVFKGSLKSVGLVCGAVVLLCISVAVDFFGIEKYVPDEDSIASVRVSGYLDIVCDAEQLPELCEKIRELHSAVVDDKDYIRKDEDYDRYWRNLEFTYTLKNGSEVERYYYVPITEARMKDGDTYDGMLYALFNDPDVLIASVTIPENAEMIEAWVDYYNAEIDGWETAWVHGSELEVVYEALLRDAAEGNFTVDSYYFSRWDEPTEASVFVRDATFCIEYRMGKNNDNNRYYGNLSLTLQPTLKHTLNALISTGVITSETIQSWNTAE